MTKILLNKNSTTFPVSITILLIYTLIVLFFLVFNPQSLHSFTGDGGGKYADKVDSYSEYIIRNTVKRNVLNKSAPGFLPILTKGYTRLDYNYYHDDYKKYYSNLALQIIPATLIAKLLNLNTEIKLDHFFTILRVGNALAFSFLSCLFFLCFCKIQKIKHHLLVPFLIGGLSGFVFFSQNLYFLSALMLMPATLIAYQLCRNHTFSKKALFLLGLAYFLRGYEFATVFALLTAFSAALFTNNEWRDKLKSALIAFFIICSAFILSLIIHVILVSADSGWSLSLSEAAQNAFATVHTRTATLSGAPLPFSAKFFHVMYERWSATAFSLTKSGMDLSELYIIIFIGLVTLLRLKFLTITEKIIITYGYLGYISWYIFAYQHIMWHGMYDWYIFSLTCGLAFALLVTIYTNALIEFIAKHVMPAK